MTTLLPAATRAAGELVGGRYRLGELLGVGGMAEVYGAEDLRLTRPVAVKLLRPEMAARYDVRTRFKAEARSAAGLSHPNAVAVYDTGEHEGTPFLVMERLPGETLADRIAAGPVDPAWLRQTAVDVLGGLAAAHAAGIVHRDVKPGNILLTESGTAKIADFGIAKSLSGDGLDLTATGQLLGTPAYLAPERLQGSPTTPTADIYALGVVLYEALTGEKPFTGDSPIAMAHAVAGGQHVPLGNVRPSLDPGLVAAVERAMARDPEARFGSAEEMAKAIRSEPTDPTVDEAPSGHTMAFATADLAAAAEAEAGTPAAPTEAASARRRRRPLPRRWLLAGSLGIFLVLVLVAVAGGKTDNSPSAQGNSASTTAAPEAAAPALGRPQVAANLRSVADGLKTATDGRRAGELAKGLRRVADRVDAGGGGPEATALLVSVAQWRVAGDLGDAATVAAIEALRDVAGVSESVAPPASTATTPPTVDSPRSGRGNSGNGNGNRKQSSDDDDD